MAKPSRISKAILTSAAFFGGLAVLAGQGAIMAAEQPSEAQIIEALKTRSRGLTPASPEAQRRDAEERRMIEPLRNRPARSLTLTERTQVGEFAKTKPSIEIEINFDYDSDVVGPKALKPLLALGRALSNEQLKGAVFLVNGHTDAKGSAEYNQDLSERRAEAVKRVLVKELGLPADTLVAIGYGKTRLKNAADPVAGENRRVQIVNTELQVDRNAAK